MHSGAMAFMLWSQEDKSWTELIGLALSLRYVAMKDLH